MKGTVLPVLLAAYRAGNRRPRGVVVERLKWLAFLASKKKVSAAGLPKGGSDCRVGALWTEADYRDMLAGIHPGVTLAELAKAQSRTITGIQARLQLLGFIYLDARYQPQWGTRVMKHKLQPKLAAKLGGAIDLCPVLRGMAWLESTHCFLLPDWLADRPVKKGVIESAPNTACLRKPELNAFSTLNQLRAAGYCVVSRRHRTIARLDREDWREYLAAKHRPWSPNNEGMRWAMSPGMADFYRRCESKDKLTLPDTVWREAVQLLPNSGDGPHEYQGA